MSDIDFDELDKAVNTLMSGVDTSKRNTALDDPEVKVVALSPAEEAPQADSAVAKEQDVATTEPAQATETDGTGVSAEEEKAPPQEPTEETAVEVATPASPSLAVKRRGQFMDMVHPSSDMKTSQRPTRREGVVIAPDPQVAPQQSATPPVEQPAEQPVAEPVAEGMPEPLVSPFLPDAKPEKRPLGSPALEPSAPVENTNDMNLESQKPVLPTPQVLPEELTGDILAIESNNLENAPAPAAEIAPSETAAPEVPVSEPVAEVVPVQPDPATTTPPAGGSIPQQYAESPSTGDQTSGSIYDTANYHQPIETAAPAKKSSPLKWILLAVGLLVVGGGAGVGYFFLTH